MVLLAREGEQQAAHGDDREEGEHERDVELCVLTGRRVEGIEQSLHATPVGVVTGRHRRARTGVLWLPNSFLTVGRIAIPSTALQATRTVSGERMGEADMPVYVMAVEAESAEAARALTEALREMGMEAVTPPFLADEDDVAILRARGLRAARDHRRLAG